jgi:two-component system response regulator
MLRHMAAPTGDVVLIEDSESDAELAIRAMRHLTDRVERFRDGGEAWAFLDGLADHPAAPRPRVVFLDNKLPLRDGLEILRRMKADPGLKSIPVVMLTSSGESRDVATAYALGVNSYLVKPVEFSEFTACVGSAATYWLERNRPDNG